MQNKVKLISAILMFGLAATSVTYAQEKSSASAAASAYIISPRDGETVTSPVKVIFGLSGIGVAPAGTNLPDTGHHHLIIDAPLPDPDLPVPSDDQHKHFGKGQTETVIELAPGEHTLQLLLGDWKHVPHDNVVASSPVKITVQ